MMKHGAIVLVVSSAVVGCAPSEQEWLVQGSREAEIVELSPAASQQRFRAFLCIEGPDEIELDIRAGGFATSTSVPVELTVGITTPEQDLTEVFPVDGRTRFDHQSLDSVVDPEGPCLAGVPIVFGTSEPPPGPIELEWALHYSFRSSEEIVDTTVELAHMPW